MNPLKSYRKILFWLLVLLMAMPATIFAQESKAAPQKFSQEELDQVLAPIALFPDSLLAQIFIAATYPLEVVMADRWVGQNKNLKGDEFSAAVSRQPWDASVKALAPFPDVLSMMSQKLDWTQKVGDAFLAQQGDVMDTVQRLRKRASEAGNLSSTEQQKVIVEREIIRIEPANPSVVFVPAFNPWWVYGPWWWPASPPFVVFPFPAGVVMAPGFIWFGTGFFVGAHWGTWGFCNWPGRVVHVNVNRNVIVTSRGAVGGAWATQPWTHDTAHRRGVAYRDPATRERFGQQANRAAVESRRSFRGYEGNWIDRGARSGRPDSATGGAGRTGRPDTVAGGTGRPGAAAGRPDAVSVRAGRTDAAGRRDAVAGRAVRADSPGRREVASARAGRTDAGLSRQASGQQLPVRASDRSTVERSRPGQVFEGIGRGSEVQRQSNWGRESLNAARSSGGTVGDAIRGGAERGGFGGASGGAGWGAAGGGFGGHGMRGGHR